MKTCALGMVLMLAPAAGIASGRASNRAGSNLIAGASRPASFTIPAETEASVQLLSGIHSRVSQMDEPIAGRLLKPVLVDGQVALPSGSLLYGRITHVRPAGRLRRPGELGLRFESVALPNGDVEPIMAVLVSLDHPGLLRVDREGIIHGAPRFSWKRFAGGLTVTGAAGALAAKLAGASAAAVGIPAAAAGWLTYELLWPHGGEVHLPPNTRCRIRLDYPLTVRNAA